MYTLRIFKNDENERKQIYLGDSYAVRNACEKDKEIGIKFRVYGNWDSHTKEGLAVHNEDNAFIMTQLGGTFEVLNRAKTPPQGKALTGCENCGSHTFFVEEMKPICAECRHELELVPTTKL
jgi:hypothetical protein